MYRNALEVDKEWIDYCFPEGNTINLLGINNGVLKQYVEFNMHNVLTNVKLPQLTKRVPNPAVWADKYAKLSNTQVAMKETDSSNYLLGKLNVEISNQDYLSFKL